MHRTQCRQEIRCGGVGLEQEGRAARAEGWRNLLNLWCKRGFGGTIVLDVLQHMRVAESPCFSWSAPTAVVSCSPTAVRGHVV